MAASPKSWSLIQRSPTMCVCVSNCGWSSSVNNEPAEARVGLLHACAKRIRGDITERGSRRSWRGVLTVTVRPFRNVSWGSKVNGHGLENRDSVPGWGKNLYSPPCPEGFWGPPNPISCGQKDYFFWVQWLQQESHHSFPFSSGMRTVSFQFLIKFFNRNFYLETFMCTR
jgi:hypothetical protein